MKRNTAKRMVMCLAGLFLCAIFNGWAGPANQLNKIFHHQGGVPGKQGILPNIELGSVVFYFAQNPDLKNITSQKKSGDQEEKVFVFEKTEVQSPEARAMMKQLNAGKGNFYSVKIEEIKGSKQAIRFSISYDPKKVDLGYDLFDSIGLQKGVVFKFFNRELLQELHAKLNKPILNVVSTTKPRGIIIDCGHGGKDAGTIGFFDIKEKDITLDVGLQLADLLKKKGFSVHLTRDADLSVGLDERTAFANSIQNAQLFISLHANHSANKNAAGIETFCLDSSLLRPLFSSVGCSGKQVVDKLMSVRCVESKLLADKMHSSVMACAKKTHATVVDRNVKFAVCQVLLGTQVPAALIELGFLSNSKEAALLNDKHYQHELVSGIYKGIVSYLDATKLS